MKKLFFIFFLLANPALYAQDDASFSLQQAIDYALANQTSVQNAQLDEQKAKATVGELRSIGLPQINGSASLIDNPELRRMFFDPANPFFGGGAGGGPPFPRVEQSGNVMVAPNIFQVRSSGDASITISQLLFDGSYFVGLQAASTYRELAKKTTLQSKIETAEKVTKAYYLVLINQERAKLFDINIQRLDSLLRDLKIMRQNGLIENIDVSRVEVQYNNLVTEKEKFDNLHKLSMMLLKFQMGIPIEKNITLTENIQSIQFEPTLGETSFDVSQRIEFSLLKTGERLQMLDLKNIRAKRLPSIAAFASGGLIRQDIRFWDLFGNKWYSYSMIGVNATIPIFGLQSQYRARQSRLELQKIRNQLNNLENGLKLEASNAEITYRNAVKSMETQKRNMELAQEVARVSKIKYKEGVGSNLEVTNAEAELKTAQINYYEAMYAAFVAKTDYQKSIGKLYVE
jgi:outer membrane protein TolC